MKIIASLLMFSLLAACGSGSDGSSSPVESRVLDEHACFDGTWLAVSRNIKINNINYPVATDRIFVVVSGQTNISHLTGLSHLQTSYSGSGLRTWTSKNNTTEDVHASRWLASFDNDSQPASGTLAIQDACRTSYSGDVNDESLPQCARSRLFERNTQLTLDCSGDVGLMTMENSKASINYQRLNENMALTSFTAPSNPHPVQPDAQPPIPVDLIEPEEIETIIQQAINDNKDETAPENDLTEEEIEQIIEEIIEEIEDTEDSNPLTPDDTSDPITPPVDEIEPVEPPDPRNIDTDGDGVNDDEDAFPFDPTETEDFDKDSIGNNSDPDDDNDGVSDVLDAFQFDPEETLDTDGDGIGNNADIDDDGDFVLDENDRFPLDKKEWADNDNDSIGDNKDPDDDNDGLTDKAEAKIGTNPLYFDTDGDSVGDYDDAFPLDSSESMDWDKDGVGDFADLDDDNDGLPDLAESVIGTNPLNPDTDGDLSSDSEDAYPLDPNESENTDGDALGNNADPDDDNDGLTDVEEATIGTNPLDQDTDNDSVNDAEDAFPLNPLESENSDDDNIGNNQDEDDDNDGISDEDEQTIGTDPLNPDTDNDGINDSNDAFPTDDSETSDNDKDNIGNNADPDDDNDGLNDDEEVVIGTNPLDPDTDDDTVSDADDVFPLDPSETSDNDNDAVGDNADMDDDNDNLSDSDEAEVGTDPLNPDTDGDLSNDGDDAFPLDPNESLDSDGDGVGDNSDAFPNDPNESLDSDGDGVGDNSDAFPNDPNESLDSDGDGVGDNSDAFPNDPNESLDSDGDGVGDNSDAFPNDPNESLDSDGDGVGDNSDAFPNDPNESLDSDGDGVGDNSDAFPNDPNESLDSDGDGVGDNSDPAPFDPSIPEDAEEPVAAVAQQDLENFYTGAAWYLTDFGLTETPQNQDYMDNDGNLLFVIKWSENTANLLEADNIECTPQLEVGTADHYGIGDSENMLASLDLDLSTCNESLNVLGSVSLQSYVPTLVGYQYSVSIDYQMATSDDVENDFRQFVVTFGAAEHFAPAYDSFNTAQVTMIAAHEFTPLELLDNGLLGDYNIIVDNIQIIEIGKAENYDICAEQYALNSVEFGLCVTAEEPEVADQCSIESMQVTQYKPGKDVSDESMVLENAFTIGDYEEGIINYLSLGKKGLFEASCYLNNEPAMYPIFNTQLSLNEISTPSQTPDTYPEQARISVHLTLCDNNKMNGMNHLGLLNTNESFNYSFTQDADGNSYSGCQLTRLVVHDKTPQSSPSIDGFDLNSLNITDLP